MPGKAQETGPETPFRHKALAALLAFVGGGLGWHRLYLGLPGWWVPPLAVAACVPWLRGDPAWFQSPAFFVAMVPVVIGFVEAIVIALTPDDRFDARFNAASPRRNRSRWDAVLVAIATMIVGSIITLTVIVLVVQTLVESRRPAGGRVGQGIGQSIGESRGGGEGGG
ncbi:MAG TPA: hypothetical protein VMU33_14250 [Burkholderiaceae bacterium]|nr:hypothetical protein [Burkholderiaceae bacterium]